jgi:uncharacterized protein (TIGR03437 family)
MFPPNRPLAARRITLSILSLTLAGIIFQHHAAAQTIDTVAGNIPLAENPEARRIPLVTPRGIALDPVNAYLYVSDDGSAAIRRINLATSQSAVVAGGGKLIDDLIPIPARSANLNFAIGLALDHSGNLFIADDAHHRIRKLTPDGLMTTVVGTGTPGYSGDGGPAGRAQLQFPKAVAFDANDNLYITDSQNGAIRRVDRMTGVISTLAGGPGNTAQGDSIPALTARLRQPYGIALNSSGDIYFTDNADHLVYLLQIGNGTLRRFAGTRATAGTTGDRGPAVFARLQEPRGVAVASNGDVYIGMLGMIRKVAATAGIITTVLGNTTGFSPLAEGAPGSAVYVPGNVEHLALAEGASRLYAILSGSNAVGQISLAGGEFSIIAGDPTRVGDSGAALVASLAQPNKIAIARDGMLYIADTFHHRIRRIAPGAGGVGTGMITTVAGTGVVSLTPSFGAASTAPMAFPRGVALDASGSLYFTTGFSMIRRIDAGGNVQTVAGTGTPGFSGDGVPANTSRLNDPWAMTLDAAGNLYIADSGNHRIRKVSPGGFITTVAGTGAPGSTGLGAQATAAQLNFPIDVRLDPLEQNLYIADQGNRRVVRVNLASGIITSAFAPINARGIAFDPNSRLILTDINRIYRVDPVTGASEVITGDGLAGFSGDGGQANLARVSGVLGVVLDAVGNILFSDTVNNRIRRISASIDPPRLTLNPFQLTFAASQGGTKPSDQVVEISTSNLARAGWISTVRTESGGNWLTVRPAAGATPAVVQVSADPAGLVVGEYTGTVSFGSAGAINSPQLLSVLLRVTAAQPTILELGPQLLTFQGIAGQSSPVAKSFTISNRGGGTLDWSVLPLTNSGGNWLIASPTSGRGEGIITVSPSTGSLAAGLYDAQIRVTNTATGRVEIITVSLTLDSSMPAMLLSQTGAVFTTTAGSTSIPSETFRVINSGVGTLNWQARITPLSGGSWLRLSSESGSAGAGGSSTISLQASSQSDTGNLAPGIYDVLVELSAEGARNSPQILLARLRVLDPSSPPIPTVRPGSLVLVATSGATQTGIVTIASSGGTNLSYQLTARTTDSSDWLVASPSSGPLAGSADQSNISIEAHAETLTPGYYTGQVAFNFSNGTTQEVGVLLVVTPSATLISSNGSSAGKGTAALEGPTSCAPASQRPWVVSLTSNVPTPTAWPVGIRAAVVDNCGNPVSRSSVIAVIASGSASDQVVLQPIGDGQYAANYAVDRDGNYLVSVTATGSGLLAGTSDPIAANSAAQLPSQATPGVSSISAADGASARQFSTLAPGQIISVTGSSLATAPSEAPTLPLPTELAGVKVSIGGRNLPLYYSSPDEMSAQVPFELTPGSDLPLLITARGNASPPQLVRIGRTSPGLFTQNQTGQGLGMVADLQGRPISPSNPAHRGDQVVAYGTGLGATVPAVASGVASPASPPATTALPVRALVGGSPASVDFAGLAPGFVGLYQVNFRIPLDAPAGDAVELYLEQDNNASNRVTIAIQ